MSVTPVVPAGWKEVRVERLLQYRKQQVNPGQIAGSRVFHYSIPVVSETGDGREEDGRDIDSNKFSLQGDELLVSKLNPHKGHLVLAAPHAEPIVCSTEFLPLAPKEGVERRFCYYLFLSAHIRSAIEAYCQSATRSHMRARPEDITKLKLLAPPPSTQKAIADYLDEKTAAIDALIEKKRKLLDLLAEERAASVSEALESLDVARVQLSHLADLLPGYAFPSGGFTTDADDVRLLRGVNVIPGAIRWTDVAYWPKDQTKGLERYWLKPGDLVIGRRLAPFLS